jgi:hypothetical protein
MNGQTRVGLASLATVLFSLFALSGCTSFGSQEPLPDSTRVPMPDLRGMWQVDKPPGGDAEAPESILVIVTGAPLDERGCMDVRVALFENNRNPYGGSKSPSSELDRDSYEPESTWCAHQFAGLIVIEQQLTDDRSASYEHALLVLEESTARWLDIGNKIWDWTAESSRHGDSTVTLSSEELEALIAEHAVELSMLVNAANNPPLTRLGAGSAR